MHLTDALSSALRDRLLAGLPASLPGLGTLACTRVPARMETRADGAQVLLPPSETVTFDSEEAPSADLAASFARRLNPVPDHPERALGEAVAALTASLHSEGSIVLPGIGHLTQTANGLRFVASPEITDAVNGSYQGLRPVGNAPFGNAPVANTHAISTRHADPASDPDVPSAPAAPDAERATNPPPEASPARAPTGSLPDDDTLDRLLDDLLLSDDEPLPEVATGPTAPERPEADAPEPPPAAEPPTPPAAPLDDDTDWAEDLWSAGLPAADSALGPAASAAFEDAEYDVLGPPAAPMPTDGLRFAPEPPAVVATIFPSSEPLDEPAPPAPPREPFDFARPMRPSVAPEREPERRRSRWWWVAAAVPVLAALAVWAWAGWPLPGASPEVADERAAPRVPPDSAVAEVGDTLLLADVRTVPAPDSAQTASTDRPGALVELSPTPGAGATIPQQAAGGAPAPPNASRSTPSQGTAPSGREQAARPAAEASPPLVVDPSFATRRTLGVAPPLNVAILPPRLAGLGEADVDALSGAAPISLGAGFSWVVLSTPSGEEAAGLASRYSSAGYRARVADTFVQGRPFFRVLIGQFRTREQAFLLRPRLAPQVSGDTWLLDHRSL